MKKKLKLKRPATGYTQSIMDACKVDADEAGIIEQVMRVQRPTLDSLTRRDFNDLARLAQEALKDPELKELYSE